MSDSGTSTLVAIVIVVVCSLIGAFFGGKAHRVLGAGAGFVVGCILLALVSPSDPPVTGGRRIPMRGGADPKQCVACKDGFCGVDCQGVCPDTCPDGTSCQAGPHDGQQAAVVDGKCPCKTDACSADEYGPGCSLKCSDCMTDVQYKNIKCGGLKPGDPLEGCQCTGNFQDYGQYTDPVDYPSLGLEKYKKCTPGKAQYAGDTPECESNERCNPDGVCEIAGYVATGQGGEKTPYGSFGNGSCAPLGCDPDEEFCNEYQACCLPYDIAFASKAQPPGRNNGQTQPAPAGNTWYAELGAGMPPGSRIQADGSPDGINPLPFPTEAACVARCNTVPAISSGICTGTLSSGGRKGDKFGNCPCTEGYVPADKDGKPIVGDHPQLASPPCCYPVDSYLQQPQS